MMSKYPIQKYPLYSYCTKGMFFFHFDSDEIYCLDMVTNELGLRDVVIDLGLDWSE